MVGTPCSAYRGSISSCLNPCGGGATKGSDICRWYGGRPSRPPPPLGGWGRNWGRLSDGGNGRHGSDICLWNLKTQGQRD